MQLWVYSLAAVQLVRYLAEHPRKAPLNPQLLRKSRHLIGVRRHCQTAGPRFSRNDRGALWWRLQRGVQLAAHHHRPGGRQQRGRDSLKSRRAAKMSACRCLDDLALVLAVWP